MTRSKRTTITKNLISKVKRSIESGIQLKKIAEILDISYSTVKRISKKLVTDENFEKDFITAYEKRPPRQTSPTTKQLVMEILDSENEMTGNEVAHELERMQIPVSQPTISRIIKSINYSRKRLTLVPVERNTVGLIDARRRYASALMLKENSDLIFLDEAGFSRHTARHYGYSPLNTKAVKFVRGSRGQNKSLLSMIQHNGCIAHMMVEGAVNRSILVDFLENNLVATPLGQPQRVLIMDNVKFHHSAEVKEVCLRKRVILLFLPAYSPHLNPIEQFFSIVKSKFKADRSAKNTFQEIKECVDRAIFSIEMHVYLNLFAEMRRNVDRAAAGELFL